MNNLGWGLLIAVWAVPVFAADVRIARPEGQNGISQLEWTEKEYSIEKVENEKTGEIEFRTKLSGKYPRDEWSLLWSSQKIKMEDDEFILPVRIRGPISKATIISVGPLGEVESEEIQLVVDNWDELVKKATKRWGYSAGLALTSIGYSETGLQDYSSISLTGKGGVNYVLTPGKWDAGLSTFITLLPLTKSAPTAARFWGVNGRVGYTLPGIAAPWSLQIMGGWYYTTMFVSGNTFGFRHMNGPQIFPVLRKQFDKTSTGSAYLKYSPVSGGGAKLNALSNREIAGGVAYTFLAWEKKYLTLGADLASLQISIYDVPSDTNIQFSVTTISLGASVNF